MIYTIENEKVKVDISTLGGELMSIQTKDETEFLWQGNKEYWSGRAYNLFPIVGRLTDGKYTYQGKTYEMNLHGFVRKTELGVMAVNKSSITFFLAANEKTLAMYPFQFEYKLTYTLKGSSVQMCIDVTNYDEKVMPCTVGGHPGFNVPLGDEGKFEDYYLEFCCPHDVQSIYMDACYTTDKLQKFELRDGVRLDLRHDLFDNDAIILTDMAKHVTLKSKTGSHSVTVDYPDMEYLGIWHKPESDAPYVCIEPWRGLPAYINVVDDLEAKRDMIHLKHGENYKNNWTITVK